MAPRRISRENPNTLYHPVDRLLYVSTHLRQFRHFIFPGLNVHHENINTVANHDEAINFYQKPLAVMKKPLPCLSSDFVSDQAYPHNDDIVLELVKEKHTWKRSEKLWTNLARTTLKDKAVMKHLKTSLKERQPITTLPYIIAKLTDHAAKDPDPYFTGLYNWYYGNAMAVTNIGNQSCIFYASGEKLNQLCFSMYNRSSSSDVIAEVNPKISISLSTDTPVFDIVSSTKYERIGVRQRSHCTFFTLEEENDNVVINQCFNVKKEKDVFVAMDVGDIEFCTVDSSRVVQFWSPDVVKYPVAHATLPQSTEYLPDKFAQIKYPVGNNFHTYVIIDRRKLYFYDKRVSYEQPYSIINPSNLIEMCEDLSLLVPSLVDNYWYVGMSHTCLLFDIRGGFVQKWTHMLPQPPSIGCTQRINKETHHPKEYLVLGTQFSNDIVAIYNKWTGCTPKSDVLPVAIPNRIETLHEARLNGLLSDPSFEKKFKRSLIGLAAYKRKKRMGIFSLVSTGDVFHQSIEPRGDSEWNPEQDTLLNQAQLEYLKSWETDYKNHYSHLKPVIKVTRLVDFTPITENFHNPDIPSKSERDLRGKAPWKKSKKTLESYTDFLTPRILQDFGICDESEWGSDTDEEILTTLTPSSIGKVKSWLAKTESTSDHNETDIEDLLNPTQNNNEMEVEDDGQSIAVSISSTESIKRKPSINFASD